MAAVLPAGIEKAAVPIVVVLDRFSSALAPRLEGQHQLAATRARALAGQLDGRLSVICRRDACADWRCGRGAGGHAVSLEGRDRGFGVRRAALRRRRAQQSGGDCNVSSPCVLVIVPVTVPASQPSGLSRNSPRSSCNASCFQLQWDAVRRSLGSRSLTMLNCPVPGSICSAARTTTVPSSNGPASSGTTIDRPCVCAAVGAGQVDVATQVIPDRAPVPPPARRSRLWLAAGTRAL